MSFGLTLTLIGKGPGKIFILFPILSLFPIVERQQRVDLFKSIIFNESQITFYDYGNDTFD